MNSYEARIKDANLETRNSQVKIAASNPKDGFLRPRVFWFADRWKLSGGGNKRRMK